ncbi:deoxycytidylate deaminase [Escherichia phage vB_EcoM_ESCO10]|nr:deoxycytidylate deaminase [Escherichia phage vB_EcoM_ESCO10]
MKLTSTMVSLEYEINNRLLEIKIFDDRSIFADYRGYRIRLEKDELKEPWLLKDTLNGCGCKLKTTQAQELISTINKYW